MSGGKFSTTYLEVPFYPVDFVFFSLSRSKKCPKDLLNADLRLHEVVSRAATLSSGIQPAGLGPVEQPGVQDVNVSTVLRGHMELQTKMGEVMRLIDLDA
jgi:hypothetical protein